MPRSAQWLVAGLLLTVFVAAGCVSRVGGDKGSPADAEAQPTSEAPPTAADGADLDACTDGTCEVLLESRRVDVPTPIGTISLTITEDGYEYSIVRADGGNASGSGEGNCVSSFAIEGNRSGSTCYTQTDDPPDLEPEPGVMQLQVLEPDSDDPILVLVTG